MVRSVRSISLAVLLLTGLASLAQARDIQISSEVPKAQAQALVNDLRTDLSLLNTTDADKALSVSDLSDRTLRLWLTSRAGYIIGENEDINSRLSILQQYQYQNPGVFPEFESPKEGQGGDGSFHFDDALQAAAGGAAQSDVVTVMANIGTAFYYFGKGKGVLIGYNFQNYLGQQEVVTIKSPRAGIIKIGEGLFLVKLDKTNPASIANTWFRLSTMFHEAHHSDGNGKSLGFPHAVCPAGHEYANRNACDRNSNGPYSAGAQIMKQARATCLSKQTCSAKEAELMAFAALDSFSRVLSTDTWDPKPEGL
jgi:hypothetical protein